jgi:transposase
MDTYTDTTVSRAGDFTRADRRRLERALAQARDVRLYRRLQGVLAVAEGEAVQEAARRARAGRVSIWRWVERYLQRHLPEDLVEGERPGRPRLAPQLSSETLAQVLSSDPRQYGYDTNGWTVPLLTAHFAAQGIRLSEHTVRRRLHAARFRWKRPRYVYSERAEHVGAKKGGSSDA